MLPAAFYEATLLTRNILSPCVIGDKSLCRHYSYPDISNYATVHGTGGFTSSGGERTRIREYYGDVNVSIDVKGKYNNKRGVVW